MNLTQFLQRVRDQLDDPNKLKWDDAKIVRHIDEQVRILFRYHIRAAKEWSNFTYMLQDTDARTLFENTYEWRLPSWIEAVTRVYFRDRTDGTGESTFSPYNWTTTPKRAGVEIQKSDPTRRTGWTWEGRNIFRLWNWSQTPDLILEVAATPAPMFRATVAEVPVAPVANAMFFPATAGAQDLGDRGFLEEGRFVNGEVQVTATAGAADIKLGEVARIIYSKSTTLDAGTRRYALTFDHSLASNVAAGDIFETLIPLEEMHLRLLVLKVVNACAVEKFNIDLQRSIAPEMAEELREYLDWARSSRDQAGPHFYLSRASGLRRGPYNPNLRWGYVREGFG